MELITINGFIVNQHRKNINILVMKCKEHALELLADGKSLKDVSEELKNMVASNKRNIRVYISYWPKTEWNKNESLNIRDKGQDCTYVSITPIKIDSK